MTNNKWLHTFTIKKEIDKKVTEKQKGVPIFYMPSTSFSLNKNRQSGFLSSTFGTLAMLLLIYYNNSDYSNKL